MGIPLEKEAHMVQLDIWNEVRFLKKFFKLHKIKEKLVQGGFLHHGQEVRITTENQQQVLDTVVHIVRVTQQQQKLLHKDDAHADRLVSEYENFYKDLKEFWAHFPHEARALVGHASKLASDYQQAMHVFSQRRHHLDVCIQWQLHILALGEQKKSFDMDAFLTQFHKETEICNYLGLQKPGFLHQVAEFAKEQEKKVVKQEKEVEKSLAHLQNSVCFVISNDADSFVTWDNKPQTKESGLEIRFVYPSNWYDWVQRKGETIERRLPGRSGANIFEIGEHSILALTAGTGSDVAGRPAFTAMCFLFKKEMASMVKNADKEELVKLLKHHHGLKKYHSVNPHMTENIKKKVLRQARRL